MGLVSRHKPRSNQCACSVPKQLWISVSISSLDLLGFRSGSSCTVLVRKTSPRPLTAMPPPSVTGESMTSMPKISAIWRATKASGCQAKSVLSPQPLKTQLIAFSSPSSDIRSTRVSNQARCNQRSEGDGGRQEALSAAEVCRVAQHVQRLKPEMMLATLSMLWQPRHH